MFKIVGKDNKTYKKILQNCDIGIFCMEMYKERQHNTSSKYGEK